LERYQIKWDGFRIIARKDGKRVKLYSRPGNDLTKRFPLIVEALAQLAQIARAAIVRRNECVPKRFASSPMLAIQSDTSRA
jgi:hypothetical protein